MQKEKSKHEKAFEEFAQRAEEELGNSLKKLILYGSVARGEETENSDVDVFAVVSSREDLERLRDLAFDIGVMEHGVFISVQGRAVEDFQDFSETSYLRNVKKEGKIYA